MSDNSENKSKPENKKPSNDDEFEDLEEYYDDSDPDQTGGEIIDNTDSSSGTHSGPHRRRVKIKKRVRVKKKTSAKRKYKKLIERIIWIVFIAGFITALYILFNQLGITDEKYKATKKRVMLMPLPQGNSTTFVLIDDKQNRPVNVNSI
ncbi:MAG: hypothetical protein ABI723_18995 [Bacteroidia bacterium]